MRIHTCIHDIDLYMNIRHSQYMHTWHSYMAFIRLFKIGINACMRIGFIYTYTTFINDKHRKCTYHVIPKTRYSYSAAVAIKS